MTATKTATKEEKKSVLIEYLQSVGDIDMNYPKTVIKTLSNMSSVKIRTTARNKTYKAAGEKAVKNVKDSDYRTFGEIAIEMEAYRKLFRIEVETCDMLFKSIGEFLKLEIMLHTQTGKNTLYDAQYRTYKVLKTHKNIVAPAYYKLSKLVNEEQNGRPATTKISTKSMEGLLRFIAEQKLAMEDRIADLDAVEADCKKALSFEAIKVYVKNHPDDAHKMLESGIKTINQGVAGYNRATGVVGDTVGFGSGGAGKAVDVTNSVISIGTAFLGKALISASVHRQAKKRLAQKDGLDDVVAFLNRDKAAVARDLAKRYVDDLEMNLDMLDPVVDGGNMLAGFALDSVGAGAATKLTALVWPALKLGLVKAAQGYQNQRLKLLEDKLNEVPPKGDEQSRMTKTLDKANALWQEWYTNSLEEIKETVKNELASLGPQKLAEIAVGELVAIFVKEMLGNLELKPAQEFSGDTLVSHLMMMTGTRENARRKVEAQDAAKARATQAS
ncbi:hypothetical protein [Labedaea rhizosphaerae]|uniref:Uncharacterized protein n=1 Tax=Labedaea rhizosphaerae TaxID=598644 RepID=A0A4R6RY73_LABRH|nr:hypothetical protein [Labedaea rhizosphaerae]TDP91814.1 hypothetical protein EV186_10823 [Labedaea rhizosphaerae]